jgi:hypothetical protein
MTGLLVRLSAAAAYGSLCAYAFYGPPEEDWSSWMFGHPWLTIMGTHLLLGALVGRWWALALALTPFFMAIPISNWNCGGGLGCIAEPLAVYVLFLTPVVTIPFVAIGVAVAKIAEGWAFELRRGRQLGDQNSSRLPSRS